MGLLDKITNKVEKYTNKFNNYVTQGERAMKELESFRSDVNRIFDTSPDTLLSDMRNMSSGVMKKVTGSWIDEIDKGMKAVADTKALVKRVNSALGTAQGIGKDLTSIGSSVMNKIGGGSVSNALGNALNYIAGTAPNDRIHNAFDMSYISKVTNYDPVSLDIDLSLLVKNLAEDMGMITNKFRGIQFSRKYHFIERPEMEIDRGGKYRSYVFFTRPDCNLVAKDGIGYRLVPDVAYYPELMTKVATDIPLYAELCLTSAGKSNLWPLLSNYAKEVAPIRLSESLREGTKNMHGVEIPIPGSPEYHNVDISVTFGDNSRGDIAKLFDMIQEYKHFVSKDAYPRRDEYIKYNACDYAMSIYIVTVDADWSIIGFGVALNCIPVEAPSHFTQHKAEGFTKQELLDEFTITFKCKTYKPHRPLYFDYFNRISGFDPDSMVDTKGCAFTLQGASRTGTGSVGTNRKSVFTTSSGAITDFNRYQGVSYSTNLDFSRLMGNQTYGGSIIPSSKSELNPVQETGNSRFFGRLPLPGVFEMLALNPGIYRALNPNEPNRPIFKLGFSY